jgi:hypothetical protein
MAFPLCFFGATNSKPVNYPEFVADRIAATREAGGSRAVRFEVKSEAANDRFRVSLLCPFQVDEQYDYGSALRLSGFVVLS